nr:hypothetical protein [Tanacetum cinerariifolium]
MVACLEKSDDNRDFHQIVDFFSSCSITYALTISPTIYASYIEQFWNTASSKTINSVKQIHAIVDGKAVVISESSVRSDLLFEDEDGITCLTNDEIFENLALMGYKPLSTKLTFQKDKAVHGKEGDRFERGITTDVCLEAAHASDNIFKTHTMIMPNVDIPQGMDTGGSPRRQDIMGGTSAQTRSERVLEQPSEPPIPKGPTFGSGEGRLKLEELMGRMIEELDKDKDVNLVSEQGEVQETAETSKDDDDATLVETLLNIRRSLAKDKGKGIMQMTKLPKKIKKKEMIQLSLDEEPFSEAEVRKNTIMYLKNQRGYKQSHFKGINLKKQRLDQQTKQTEETEEEVEAQDDSDQEIEEIKLYMRIIPNEDIEINAIPLAIKPLVIVKYKIIKEGKISTYLIVRADGTIKRLSMPCKALSKEISSSILLLIETTEEGTKIIATVDGKLKTVFESSIRRNLKLNDEAGISSLPDTELFENLQLMGYNILPNQKFTIQKGQFSHQWKYLIHTIMQCLSPKSTGFNEFSSNIATALVCLATNSVYNFSKMIFDDEHTSPIGDDSQGEACLTNSVLEADQDRANIAKTSTLPSDLTSRVTSLAADEGSMQQKLNELTDLCTSLQRKQSEMVSKFEAQELEINSLKARIKLLEDKDGGVAKQSGDDAPIKGMRLDEGKEVAERVSDDTEEMATVLTSMDAASILTGGGVQVVHSAAEVATATVSIPTGSGLVSTASPTIPSAALIFTTATESTPYTRKKGKEKMVESDTPKKKKFSNVGGFCWEVWVEVVGVVWRWWSRGKIGELQLWRVGGKNCCRCYSSWFERGREKSIFGQFSPLVPQLVPIEEVYVEALQVKHPIIDWKVHTKGHRREDLNQLWELVKETLSIRPTISDKEIEIWVELKRLYEPDVEDQLWTHTQNLMHAPVEWKLYDICGVHHVTSKDKEISMLVEKDYPLRKGLAIGMISYKLQVENYSKMENDLILKIYKIASIPTGSDEFPLPEQLPTANEDKFPLLIQSDATAMKLALLLKSRNNCQSKTYLYHSKTTSCPIKGVLRWAITISTIGIRAEFSDRNGEESGMADLAFAPQHNMIAYLEKAKSNDEFHQIVDFLTSSSIHHSLTVSPTIYASNIEQFWNSATSQTINDEKQIHAIVDGHTITTRNFLVFPSM